MQLHVQILGEGKAVVILHGLFGMSDNWMSIARKLSSHYQVLVPDLRNHGRSAHSEEWNYQVMSEDVLELLKENNLEQVTLIGHSMGGKVAMQIALNHPEKVERLMVVDIAPKAYKPSEEHLLILQALKEIDLVRVSSRKQVEEKLIPYGFENEVNQFILKNLVFQNDVYSWRVNFLGLEKNAEQIGSEIKSENAYTGPTLFLRGSLSTYIQESDQASILKLFPKAHIQSIPGSDHWVHSEKPIEFFEALEKFIS